MVEWNELQGDQFYNLVELYEREARQKATDQMYVLIN